MATVLVAVKVYSVTVKRYSSQRNIVWYTVGIAVSYTHLDVYKRQILYRQGADSCQ